MASAKQYNLCGPQFLHPASGDCRRLPHMARTAGGSARGGPGTERRPGPRAAVIIISSRSFPCLTVGPSPSLRPHRPPSSPFAWSRHNGLFADPSTCSRSCLRASAPAGPTAWGTLPHCSPPRLRLVFNPRHTLRVAFPDHLTE